jgi:hypothetical protein
MSTNETGGPAFPSKKRVQRAGYETSEFEPFGGMTLRDYFAAKAMAAQLLHPLVQSGEGTRSDVAMASYQMADSMLEARKC